MEEQEVYEAPAMKWQWKMLVIRLLLFVASGFGTAGRLFAGVAEDVTSHVNYKAERDEFAEQAGLELEAIVEGPEED